MKRARSDHSCGCLAKEHLKDMADKNVTHGMTGTRLYGCYKGMMSRCYRKKDIHYKAYGGRGIVVCDEWKNDAKAFIDWALTHGYSDEWMLGYGYYGHYLTEDGNGRYYIVHRIGNSCD